jgi:5-methylcytosine-specific restriction endonuclease McrA
VVNLSQRIDDTPALAAAVRGGDVSLDQATQIAKAETAAPGCADTLIEVAREQPFHVLAHQARTAVLEHSRDNLGARQRAARRASHHVTELGLVHVEADLEPHIGAPIITRLETEAKRLASRSESQEPWQAHLADAFAAAFDHPSTGRPSKPELVIVLSHEVAARGWTDVKPGEVCHIPGVGPIDPRVAKDIAQDAFITGVVSDGKDLGQMRRWTRAIPVEVRLALRLGPPPDFDGPRCVDCGNRYTLEHDHDTPRSQGGPTSLGNLADRCHPCHLAKTKTERRRPGKHLAAVAESQDRAPPQR